MPRATPKPGAKAEREQLRRAMLTAGQPMEAIAEQMRVRFGFRRRDSFRHAHGWSQDAAAAEYNHAEGSRTAAMTGERISRYELWPNGGERPSPAVLVILARVYHATIGQLLDPEEEYPRYPLRDRHVLDALCQATGPGAREPSPQPMTAPAAAAADTPSQEEDRPAYDRLVQLLTEWAGTVNRRELLRILGVTPTVGTANVFGVLDPDEQRRTLQAACHTVRVDEQVVGSLETMATAMRNQDDRLGPFAAFDTAMHQRQLAESMLPDCPSSLRPRLLSVYANLTSFVGWLMRDVQKYEEAWRRYEQARAAAHEARNVELSVFILSEMSQSAIEHGRIATALDHASAAEQVAADIGDLRLRAYSADSRARALANDQQADACRDALLRAERLLSSADDASPPGSLAYFYGSAMQLNTRARCHLQLGRTAEAEAAAQAAGQLEADGPFVRRAVFRNLYVARIHAAAREPEAAAQALGHAAELATPIRSTRIFGELSEARAQLTPWRETPAVRDLDERLHAYQLV